MDASIFPTMLGCPPLPVLHPTDHQNLFKQSMNQTPAVGYTNPLLFKQFANKMEAPVVRKAPSLLEMHYQEQQQMRQKETARTRPENIQTQKANTSPLPERCCSTPSTSASTLASSVSDPASAKTKVATPTTQTSQLPPNPFQFQPKYQGQPQPQTHPAPPPPPATDTPFLNPPSVKFPDATPSTDPKYAQIVSRMGAYYQQRCQAILNYQSQRCQAWAASHRQKCQESREAAMLVVAWYIRDRINRRKRRSKRSFRRGLREKNAAGRSGAGRPKGERVRKWVQGIPETGALSPSNGIRDDEGRMDREEREFDVEKEMPVDKETQLFSVADRMIKSQLARIDVPLLGALNLDDSDCESESEDERYYEPADYDMEDDEDDEEYEYEDDDEYEEESGEYVEDGVSKEAQNGTGKGSLKRKHSESE